MLTNEKAPTCWRTNGARKQDNFGKYPVPIVTHPRPLRKRVRIKMIWTPLNVALLVLLVAAGVYFAAKALAVDPLQQRDLISMASSVMRA